MPRLGAYGILFGHAVVFEHIDVDRVALRIPECRRGGRPL